MSKSMIHVFQKSFVGIIRQKGKSQDGGNKKTKLAQISEKRTFLTP